MKTNSKKRNAFFLMFLPLAVLLVGVSGCASDSSNLQLNNVIQADAERAARLKASEEAAKKEALAAAEQEKKAETVKAAAGNSKA